MGGVDNVGGYVCVKAEGIYEISQFCSQFCCKPKTDLKKNPKLVLKVQIF